MTIWTSPMKNKMKNRNIPAMSPLICRILATSCTPSLPGRLPGGEQPALQCDEPACHGAVQGLGQSREAGGRKAEQDASSDVERVMHCLLYTSPSPRD